MLQSGVNALHVWRPCKIVVLDKLIHIDSSHTFINSFSILTGSFSFAKPNLVETLLTCVSTVLLSVFICSLVVLSYINVTLAEKTYESYDRFEGLHFRDSLEAS